MKNNIHSKTPDSGLLEAIPYEHTGKRISVNITSSEFTCFCPWTGHPDFATIRVCYVPGRKCVELKSFKLYLHSYRDVGMVHESVVNRIADDLVKACSPLELHVAAEFNTRGGIKTTVSRDYRRRK